MRQFKMGREGEDSEEGGRGRCGPAQWGRGGRREHSIIHDMVWYAQRPLSLYRETRL